MNQENKQPETVEQAAKRILSKHSIKYSGIDYIDQKYAIEAMVEISNLTASQHSYTEQKWIKSPESIIDEMCGIMPYNLVPEIRNYIYEAMQIYAKQFYTQEQMIAFGEAVLKEAIKICDYTMNNAQIKQVNGIDISKHLNK